MKIVITDSGLGGLSVLAELEKRLALNPISNNIELIFANALYSRDFGYNSMPDIKAKSKVFNNFLLSISEKYNPDLILIACNTLSVVFPFTEFSKKNNIKVTGIVESGTELFLSKIKPGEDKILLFGTPTTINSNVYKANLMNSGIASEQIISQECPHLETLIQNNPNSEKVKNAISDFVDSALLKLNTLPKKIYAGLCCTHYGYSFSIFEDNLKNKLNCEIEVLNPNGKMLDFIFTEKEDRITSADISVRIISQVEIPRDEINNLSYILGAISPLTARALKNYELKRDLFNT